MGRGSFLKGMDALFLLTHKSYESELQLWILGSPEPGLGKCFSLIIFTAHPTPGTEGHESAQVSGGKLVPSGQRSLWEENEPAWDASAPL